MKRTNKIFLLSLAVILCVLLASCSKDTGDASALFDFTFKLNDVEYTIPESIETFTNAGWSFPENFNDFDHVITPGNLKSTYLILGENWLGIEIFNKTENELALKNCPIGRVTYDFSGDIKVYTAGDFCLNGKTLDEVISKYGQPFSQMDYSTYTEVIYDKDPSKGIYDRYTFKFNKNTKEINDIDIIYFYK